MRFLTTVLLLATTCAHAQYFTKPRAEQVFVKTNMLQIIKSNDLQGALICIDTNLMNIYSNSLTADQIGNIITSNINENVQTLVYDALGDFLTNYPHTYADSSGYQNFFATSTRTDSVINRDLRVDRDALIGRYLTVSGTVTAVGNAIVQRDLTVGTNATVGGNATVSTNLTVGSNLTVNGTATFAGPGTGVVVNSTLLVGAPESVSQTGVIVQVSYNDSQVSTAADAGSTNRFASGVSSRFIESRYGTIRGGLDGAPAEVYPSWRMVYIGASSGTNPWSVASSNLIPADGAVYVPFPYSKTNPASWSIPTTAGWTNIYAPARFGVQYGQGALTILNPGMYRISYSVVITNTPYQNAYVSSQTFQGAGWTNSAVGDFYVVGEAPGRFMSQNRTDRISFTGTCMAPLGSGTTFYPGIFMRQTYCSSAGFVQNCRISVLRFLVYVEWMPLPSTLVGGVSPTAPLFDAPVPTTQFDEASALQALK